MLELHVTFGITPEAEALLSRFTGLMSTQKSLKSIENCIEKAIDQVEIPSMAESDTQTKKAKREKVSKPTTASQPVEQAAAQPAEATAELAEASIALTREQIKNEVVRLAKSDRGIRNQIEAKFGEYGAGNTSQLDVQYFEEFWDFLQQFD